MRTPSSVAMGIVRTRVWGIRRASIWTAQASPRSLASAWLATKNRKFINRTNV